MGLFPSIMSIPELAPYSPKERRRIIRAATKGKLRGHPHHRKGVTVCLIAIALIAVSTKFIESALGLTIPAQGMFKGIVYDFLLTTPLVIVVMRFMVTRYTIPTILPMIREYLQHYCINCGYDLTGNQSGICPECGRAIGPSQKPVGQ